MSLEKSRPGAAVWSFCPLQGGVVSMEDGDRFFLVVARGRTKNKGLREQGKPRLEMSSSERPRCWDKCWAGSDRAGMTPEGPTSPAWR